MNAINDNLADLVHRWQLTQLDIYKQNNFSRLVSDWGN
jgi:hypothetical protein